MSFRESVEYFLRGAYTPLNKHDEEIAALVELIMVLVIIALLAGAVYLLS